MVVGVAFVLAGVGMDDDAVAGVVTFFGWVPLLLLLLLLKGGTFCGVALLALGVESVVSFFLAGEGVDGNGRC